MHPTVSSARTRRPRLRALWLLASGALTTFIAATLLEHLLNPHLDPARHQISEYVNTASGAMMVGALLAWAASIAAVAEMAWRRERAATLAGCCTLASLGLLMTALFATDTSAGELPPGRPMTIGGTLHNIGSGTATVALLTAAIASAASLRRHRGFRVASLTLVVGAALINTFLLAAGPDVGGVRQRLLVATACVWQAALLSALRRGSE